MRQELAFRHGPPNGLLVGPSHGHWPPIFIFLLRGWTFRDSMTRCNEKPVVIRCNERPDVVRNNERLVAYLRPQLMVLVAPVNDPNNGHPCDRNDGNSGGPNDCHSGVPNDGHTDK